MDTDPTDWDPGDTPLEGWDRPEDISSVEESDTVGIGEALAALDGDGVVMLVVGEVPGGAQAAVCRQLMGDVDAQRRRVVALSGAESDAVGRRLPDGAPRDDDHLRVVADSVEARDGVAVDSGRLADGASVDASVVTVDGEVGSFGAAIVDAIDELEPAGRGFEPGELRLGVDELRPLFEQVPREDVVQFVHLLGQRVRNADGKAHFHLPVAPDDRRASVLAAVCDLLVHVRIRDGETQQQWHVRNGPTSEWLPVPVDVPSRE